MKAVIELQYQGATGDNGQGLASAKVGYAALSALVGAGTKTLLDPVGASYSVTIDDVQAVEYQQDEKAYPSLLVTLTATEV
jgi:hypothetical protein